MADQQAAHLIAHRSLLQGDGAQPSVLGAISGILAQQFWLPSLHGHTKTPSFAEQGLIQCGILRARGVGPWGDGY